MSISRCQNTSSFVSYQDAALGIKSQYLENWIKIVHYSANNSRIEFISPLQSQLEIFLPSFLVGASKTTSKLTLDGLSKTILNKARESMIAIKQHRSGSISAQQLIYTFKSSDTSLQLPFRTMDILMIKSNSQYTFSYTESRAQYANILSTTEQNVHSFEAITK
jgi:hypothetical protein